MKDGMIIMSSGMLAMRPKPLGNSITMRIEAIG
jgi:hypothetical protein